MDKALGNLEWMELFPSARVYHLNKTSSDHVPIPRNWTGRIPIRGKKQFRYEESWHLMEGCAEAVKKGWKHYVEGSPMFRVTEKIKLTRMKLNQWVCSNVRSGPREILELEDKLTCLLGQPFTDDSIEKKNELIGKLNRLLEQDEQFWRQRSKENWIKLGDRNTKYFHHKANRRQQRNCYMGYWMRMGNGTRTEREWRTL